MVDDSGRIWVFWSSERAGESRWDLWYITSVDGGSSWSSPAQFTTHELWDYAPIAIQSTDGRLWVAWYSYRSGNWDIWYKTSSDDGATWSDAHKLTSLTGNEGWNHNPDLIEIETDDNPNTSDVWVFWHSTRSGNADIWATWTCDGGQSWAYASFPASSGYAARICVDPTNADKVYAAGYRYTYDGGVYTYGPAFFRSADGVRAEAV